jgi:UDP-N-acetylmuramate--alanine ligase
VVTSAVPASHPELERARALGIPVIRRAEALADAVAVGDVVGIAGTHGKTTTTVMTTEALAAAGLAPTGIAGGRVGAWRGNLSDGGERLFVVEADEYDRSFLALAPTVAVVTNIEADHLDIYADLADIRDAFARFVRGARVIVLCADDPGANTLPTPNSAEVIRYGIESPDARLVARDVRTTSSGTTFSVVYDGDDEGEVMLRVPGHHNVLNALAGLASGLALGSTVAGMAPGLAAFAGVERRFQRVGEAAGVVVVDDYAHHPTELRVTLAAARAAFPGRRIVAAFQPHLYSRTRDFASEFGAALAEADAIFLTEIYPARERPIDGVSAALVERAAVDAGGAIGWRGERSELADALARAVRSGDVVLTIGAGDITRTGPELLARLTAAA